MFETEATVAICRCLETHKVYGVRFGKMQDGTWRYTWAFPIKESAAKREGYLETIIRGDVIPDDEYPGCPYCGAKHFIVCGDCGGLNCNPGIESGTVTCEWCGATGELTGYDGGGIRSGGDV